MFVQPLHHEWPQHIPNRIFKGKSGCRGTSNVSLAGTRSPPRVYFARQPRLSLRAGRFASTARVGELERLAMRTPGRPNAGKCARSPSCYLPWRGRMPRIRRSPLPAPPPLGESPKEVLSEHLVEQAWKRVLGTESTLPSQLAFAKALSLPPSSWSAKNRRRCRRILLGAHGFCG